MIAGPGTVDRLASELDRYGCRSALVVTGATVAASPLARRVESALGSRCAGVFTGARQHVPASSVRALLAAARAAGIDCLVSLGGGSPIDTAKAVVHAFLVDTKDTKGTKDTKDTKGAKDRGEVRCADGIIHVAVPTTLSAGEFTDVAGVTDDETRIKHALADPRIAPRTVIVDPEATLRTPDALWAASGIRALDHAIESLYSRRHHPISDPLAERAIETLLAQLPASLSAAGAERLAARGECQMAAWLAVFGVTNAGFGLSHVLGHQIGPRWDVVHGITSAIVLPHAMRFMADAAAERFGPIARAFGVPFDRAVPRPGALACADHAGAFIAGLGLPTRLRDAGVPRADLSAIAPHVADVMHRAGVIDRPVGAADITDVLEAAY